MALVKMVAKFAGAATLGAAVAFHDEKHVEVENYEPVLPWGHLVTIANSTTSMTTTHSFASSSWSTR